ncbi:phenylacetate-CoA ligase (fragment) [Burkholderia vietnamiensis]
MVVPMSGGQTEKQVQLIRDFEPKIILVTPSYMLNLIDEMVRQGMDPADSSLQIGIFGAEPWTQALRDEVETRAGIDALDIYGLSEVMGPGVACECVETKDGPVIWEDHFYPEIIDPATGEVLPDGSAGELVFTSLTKEAMPVIRYRTRDLTALLPPTARAMRRLAKITGRSDDMLIVRGVNVFPSQIEEIVVAQARLSGQFQVTLSRDGHMDRLELAVELRSEAAAGMTDGDRAAIARELQHRIKTMIGVSAGVTVLAAGGIPTTATGKARRVIDRRQAA